MSDRDAGKQTLMSGSRCLLRGGINLLASAAFGFGYGTANRRQRSLTDAAPWTRQPISARADCGADRLVIFVLADKAYNWHNARGSVTV